MALSGVFPLTRFAALNQSPVQARKKWDQAALQQLCREPSSDTAAECHSIEDLNCCLIQVLQRCLPLLPSSPGLRPGRLRPCVMAYGSRGNIIGVGDKLPVE